VRGGGVLMKPPMDSYIKRGRQNNRRDVDDIRAADPGMPPFNCAPPPDTHTHTHTANTHTQRSVCVLKDTHTLYSRRSPYAGGRRTETKSRQLRCDITVRLRSQPCAHACAARRVLPAACRAAHAQQHTPSSTRRAAHAQQHTPSSTR